MPNARDKNQEAKLRFSEALFRVWVKRGDFEAMVMEGHRQLAAKTPGVDPVMSACKMQVGLGGPGCDMSDPATVEARLALVRSVLYVWYKVTPDIKSAVMESVREIAIAKGEDPLLASLAADDVLNEARGAGQAISEQHAAAKVEQETREQSREQRNRQRVLDRLD